LAILMVAQGCDTDIADGCLELDERVSSVVKIRWASFTAGTEISIVAHGTLVSIALDISLNNIGRVAKRSVAIDAVVTGLACVGSRHRCGSVIERFVNWHESVTRMNETCVGNAGSAEVPIWAVKALVADTIDILVTTVANSVVTNVAAWSEKSFGNQIKVRILNSRLKCMIGVVAMLHSNVA
jgi:hypothetical protein